MDRRRRVMNRFEAAAEKALREGAAQYGARVFTKLSIAQALEIRGSGLSDEEFAFALKAHFDFVVARMGRAEFAVEIDGPMHFHDETTQARDAMKDRLSRKLGMPLFRIDITTLQAEQQYDLLLRLVRIWYTAEEPSNHRQVVGMVAEDGATGAPSNGQNSGPLPAAGTSIAIGLSELMTCQTAYKMDSLGYYLAATVLQIEDYRFLVGQGRCKVPDRSPIDGYELAERLSLIDALNRMRALMLPRA